MPRSSTYLGTVQDVEGATIRALLDHDTRSGLVFVDGNAYRIGQVGSFARIPMGFNDLFGIVAQVGAGAAPTALDDVGVRSATWMRIQLIGEAQHGCPFQRGVGQYPAVGDEVHLVTEKDLSRIYGTADLPDLVSVGCLASTESIPALLDVNKLVNRHSAVLGTTGSGKSTTVASLLHAMTEESRFPSARVIVLDTHGEYASALRGKAAVFRTSPDEEKGERALYIPYWSMTFDEFLGVSLADLGDTERGAVMEKLVELKQESLAAQPKDGITDDSLNVDSPVPFSVHRMWLDLHRLVYATHTTAGGQSHDSEALALDDGGAPVQPGDAISVIPPIYRPQTLAAGEEKIYLSTSRLNLRRPLDGLASRLRDPRFDFLFRPGPWMPDEAGSAQGDLDSLVEQWIGGEEPISILDLSGIPVSVVKRLVGVLLRVVFDCLFWSRNLSEGGRERPLLVVLEEAHAYLGNEGKGMAAKSAQRLVKEGRKYGIGTMIVSQRPSEIDPTVLSQCGTLIAMRLSNSTDRSQVAGAAPDNLEGLFAMLPSLRIGEAVIVGEAVHLPMRALIGVTSGHHYPDSHDPLIYSDALPGGWNRHREEADYSDVVEVWRAQNPRSPRAFRPEGGGMERVSLASSNVASAGYDAQTSTLEVEFLNGNIYQYFDVPEHIYEGLLAADSPGGYLNDTVKGIYRYARL